MKKFHQIFSIKNWVKSIYLAAYVLFENWVFLSGGDFDKFKILQSRGHSAQFSVSLRQVAAVTGKRCSLLYIQTLRLLTTNHGRRRLLRRRRNLFTGSKRTRSPQSMVQAWTVSLCFRPRPLQWRQGRRLDPTPSRPIFAIRSWQGVIWCYGPIYPVLRRCWKAEFEGCG